VLAFDHVRKEIWLVATADASRGKPSDAFDKAVKRLDKLEARLAQPLPRLAAQPVKGKLKVRHRTAKKDFLAAVARTREYIAAGDIFQAVISQRFDVEPGVDSFQVYRALRTVNPSPYMYFLRFAPEGPLGGLPDLPRHSTKKLKQPTVELAGSSPELLVRVHQGKVEYRPIAGTRPRGATEKEDQALAEEMLHDEKERAEHVMLVDLARNDIGRVCDFGSVQVKDLMIIERYSHVMHIVSQVEGRLAEGRTPYDLMRATFPAGTLSGAPKIRAMQIIAELEQTARGPYGGCMGYFSFNGNLDCCITIRTALLKDGKAYVQAGGGWVNDSTPEAEFQETLNKAKAMLKAVAMAENFSQPPPPAE